MHKQATEYDIAIVGGGLVGISLACALAQLQPAPRVALIESYDYSSLAPPGFDSRTIALSFSSRQIFSAMRLWPALSEQACAIHTIHISDRGHPGITHLRASEQGVDALGYVIENRVMGQTLLVALRELDCVELLAPARVSSLELQTDRARLNLAREAMGTDKAQANVQSISARLVVAADGTDSFVRQYLGIEQRNWDYHQSAVIANVATSLPHRNIAYERFTHSGPMALLPLNAFAQDANRYGLVWTVPEHEVEQVMQLGDADFAAALQQRFGRRVGEFVRIGQRASYPLGLNYIAEHVRPRLAFIGNAAHTLHPVAGQGFNLGLRDVAAIVEVIQGAQQQGRDIGDLKVLQDYARWRQRDHQTTMLFTDAIVRIFSNHSLPFVAARNAGLMAMELFAPVRKRLTRHAMGYIGKASLLARGLGLS